MLLKRRHSQDLGSPELRRAIADALRELRAKHEHSQESLARMIPCDRSMITRVEMGRHNPTYAWLERIVQALGENMVRFARLVEKYRSKKPNSRRKLLKSLWILGALRVSALMSMDPQSCHAVTRIVRLACSF
jgi:transcriptional regulator with XRE-family HTH domain